MSNKVYVGGLPWSTDNDALQGMFTSYGEVVEAKVITDRETGRSRGFGFVTFASEEEAKKACELNGTELEGRTIRVDLARENREGGGRGGGGGGRGPRGGGRGGFGGGRGGYGGGRDGGGGGDWDR
jgi:RNA recognition motif-containing protein